MSNLEQRTILLTGASQGIGASTAAILRGQGASLIAHHRGDAERADLVAELGEEDGDRLKFVAGDFMQDAQVDRMWADALASGSGRDWNYCARAVNEQAAKRAATELNAIHVPAE